MCSAIGLSGSFARATLEIFTALSISPSVQCASARVSRFRVFRAERDDLAVADDRLLRALMAGEQDAQIVYASM